MWLCLVYKDWKKVCKYFHISCISLPNYLFPLPTMADALISLLLEQLASITYQQIEKEVTLVLDAKKEVAKFTSNLQTIQSVLDDVEKRQVEDPSVRDWLDKLKDVSHEMDDVLDEWKTKIKIIQLDIQETADEGEKADVVTKKKKVCFSIFPSHCFCFGQVNRVILRRDIALKIKDLNDQLNDIAKQREMYGFQPNERRIEKSKQVVQTSSFVDTSKIFGRDKESKIIVDMLLSEISTKEEEEESGPVVIPIIGMGGMGKTTLAQLAFNDPNVTAHFQRKIWVCVSDPFDEIAVAKAIIGNGAPSSNQLDDVLQCLSSSIEGNTFLIVLDDVWAEWQHLKLPLRKGAKGSKILVTTRKKDVAIRMGARESRMIHLEKLNEESCWLLFHHIAFFDREEESNLFEPIGKEIVRKCKGLPLAAKCLGSLMRFKKSRKEWQDVRDSKIWKLKEVEQEVFQPLLLSYYELESTTKRCLLYCATFPKDYDFEQEELIQLWMSQDYLYSEDSQEKNSIGEDHFNSLVMRSFFQDFGRSAFGDVRVKMHDIVHDFVQFLTKKECLSMEIKDATKRVELPGGYKLRHLTLMLAVLEVDDGEVDDGEVDDGHDVSLLPIVSENDENCKSIRTLATFGSIITTLAPDLILQLKGLRTLKLSGSRIAQVPMEIGELIHLRYLDLSGNRMKELPESVCNLYNLETLRLSRCSNLEKLPKAIGKLINLKHLHFTGCHQLNQLPKGIGRLTNLRILDEGITMRTSDDDDVGHHSEIFQLGDLGLLDKLQGGLMLSPEKMADPRSEAERAQLWNKKDIITLALYFSGDDNTHDEILLDALKAAPPNLETLYIWRYRSIRFAHKWMISLQHLTEINFFYWISCEALPPLGKLPSLERLEISYMMRLKKVGVEFLGISSSSSSEEETPACTAIILFPKLKYLEFCNMNVWEQWQGVPDEWMEGEDGSSEITIMPCLSSLSIDNAENLQGLPNFLKKTPLQRLKISTCTLLELRCRKGGEEGPKISHIPEISLNDQFIRRDGVWED